MTDEIRLEVTCVHCLEKGTQGIFPIIKRDNLKAREGIFNQELFLYRCLHCGHYQKIAYECVYQDDQLKYMIILAHDGDDFLSKIDTRGYQIKFVKELSELREKIIIKEYKLNDRIIEIMKNKIRDTLISKASYRIFLHDEGGCLLFRLIYPDNEIIKTFVFSHEEYFSLEEKYGVKVNTNYVVG